MFRSNQRRTFLRFVQQKPAKDRFDADGRHVGHYWKKSGDLVGKMLVFLGDSEEKQGLKESAQKISDILRELGF